MSSFRGFPLWYCIQVLTNVFFTLQGGMGDQGMMFGNEPTTSTQVTIPKDVSVMALWCYIQ